MEDNLSKYTTKAAQEEAEKIQKKVISGTAKNYKEAEEIIDIEKKEQVLSPEIMEKIMNKVRNINELGTAFTRLGFPDSAPEKEKEMEKIRSILKHGVLGNFRNMESMDKTTWSKELRKEGKGPKPSPVFFNIIGRSIDERSYVGTGSPIKFDNKYSVRVSYSRDWRGLMRPIGFKPEDSLTLIFDITKFKEVGLPSHKEEKEGGVGREAILKPYTYWAADPDRRNDLEDFFQKLVLNPEQRERAWEPGSKELKAASEKFPNLVNKEGFVQPSEEYGFILPYRIDPRLFMGLALSASKETTSELVKIMQESYSDNPELLIPIYDTLGNLLWPQKISYEELKKIAIK